MIRRLARLLLLRLAARLAPEPDVPEEEDPETILRRAEREMAEMQAKNRERAVSAITQKNNLLQMVGDTKKRVADLQSKSELAAARGDHEQARQLLREREQYASTLASLQRSADQAVDTVEAVKTAIRREEERIREKTAALLSRKARWKAGQIDADLRAAFEEQERARTRVGDRDAEAMRRIVADLRREADARVPEARAALERGDWRGALALLRERERCEEALVSLRRILDP